MFLFPSAYVAARSSPYYFTFFFGVSGAGEIVKLGNHDPVVQNIAGSTGAF